MLVVFHNWRRQGADLTTEQSVFMRIQVRASSQTKGVEQGWKQWRACEARAVRARRTLTPRFTDFFTDFEEKTDCFAV